MTENVRVDLPVIGNMRAFRQSSVDAFLASIL